MLVLVPDVRRLKKSTCGKSNHPAVATGSRMTYYDLHWSIKAHKLNSLNYRIIELVDFYHAVLALFLEYHMFTTPSFVKPAVIKFLATESTITRKRTPPPRGTH